MNKVPQHRGNILAVCCYLAVLTVLIGFSFFAFGYYLYDYDFWHYCALTKAFSKDLLHPTDPFSIMSLPLTSPYWFYSLLTGFFSHLLNIEPFQFLPIIGIGNVVFFAAGLLFLVRTRGHSTACAAWLLFLHLTLWGYKPWIFSGFFHLWALPVSAPYPATFAMGTALFGCALFSLWTTKEKVIFLILSWLFGLVTLVSHPLTFIFFAVTCFSFALTSNRQIRHLLILVGISILYPVLLGKLPLFPLQLLTSSGTYVAHYGGLELYHGLLIRIFPPLLIGIFIIARNLRNRAYLPLLLMLLCFSTLYSFGAVSEMWNFGRVISYSVFSLHWIIALYLSSLDRRALRSPLIALGGGVLTLVLLIRPLLDTLQQLPQERLRYIQQIAQLAGNTKITGPVLASWRVSRMLPCFGATPFVYYSAPPEKNNNSPTHEARERFLTFSTPLQERMDIVREFQISSVILERSLVMPDNEMIPHNFSLEEKLDQGSLYLRQGGTP